MKTTFLVIFEKPDGTCYHWRWYKTFGGAYRFVQNNWCLWGFRHGHGFSSWAIERQQTVKVSDTLLGFRFTKRCAILCNSLGFKGELSIRRERLV